MPEFFASVAMARLPPLGEITAGKLPPDSPELLSSLVNITLSMSAPNRLPSVYRHICEADLHLLLLACSSFLVRIC